METTITELIIQGLGLRFAKSGMGLVFLGLDDPRGV